MSYKIKFKEQEDIKLGDVTQNDVIEVRKVIRNCIMNWKKRLSPLTVFYVKMNFQVFAIHTPFLGLY